MLYNDLYLVTVQDTSDEYQYQNSEFTLITLPTSEFTIGLSSITDCGMIFKSGGREYVTLYPFKIHRLIIWDYRVPFMSNRSQMTGIYGAGEGSVGRESWLSVGIRHMMVT